MSAILENLVQAGLFLVTCVSFITFIWLSSHKRYRQDLCQIYFGCDPSQPLTPQQIAAIQQRLYDYGLAVQKARIETSAKSVKLFLYHSQRERPNQQKLATAERQLNTAYGLARQFFSQTISLRPVHDYILPELDNYVGGH